MGEAREKVAKIQALADSLVSYLEIPTDKEDSFVS